MRILVTVLIVGILATARSIFPPHSIAEEYGEVGDRSAQFAREQTVLHTMNLILLYATYPHADVIEPPPTSLTFIEGMALGEGL